MSFVFLSLCLFVFLTLLFFFFLETLIMLYSSETGSHAFQANFQLAVEPRMTLDSLLQCLPAKWWEYRHTPGLFCFPLTFLFSLSCLYSSCFSCFVWSFLFFSLTLSLYLFRCLLVSVFSFFLFPFLSHSPILSFFSHYFVFSNSLSLLHFNISFFSPFTLLSLPSTAFSPPSSLPLSSFLSPSLFSSFHHLSSLMTFLSLTPPTFYYRQGFSV